MYSTLEVSAASETELGTYRYLRAFCANGTHIRNNSSCLGLNRLSPPYGTRTGPFYPLGHALVVTPEFTSLREVASAQTCPYFRTAPLVRYQALVLGGIEPPLYHPVVLFTGICNFRPACRYIRASGLFDGRGLLSLPSEVL